MKKFSRIVAAAVATTASITLVDPTMVIANGWWWS